MKGGDSFSDDGYKYTNSDRVDMDGKVWLGAEGHHHIGGTITVQAPSGPPVLTRLATGGLVPAGTRVYYKISLVNTRNQESVASSEAFIDTPDPVLEPSGPSLTFTTIGGALLGGDYYYALTAYTGITTNETRANGTAFLSVNSTTGLNKVTLTYPSLPAGATGFNIYRRAPGEMKYFHLASVDMTGITPPTTYVDNGSVAENCDRTVPTTNTTNATNAIRVSYPGATPVVPSGYTWRIYRTYLNGNYASSLLVNVVEYTAETIPVITPTYLDVGIPTTPGEPIVTAPVLTNPDKILLTNGREVQGSLPLGMTAFPWVETFTFPGVLSVTSGSAVWVCEYPNVEIIGCRAALGHSSKPAAQPVIVDVNVSRAAATPTETTIYTTQANRPQVAVGTQVGARTRPDVVAVNQGDYLTVDVDQSGGGAATDRDLTVNIYMIVYGFPTTSFVPGSGAAGY